MPRLLFALLPEFPLGLATSGASEIARRKPAGLLVLRLEPASGPAEIARRGAVGRLLALPLEPVTAEPPEMPWRWSAGAFAGPGDAWACGHGSADGCWFYVGDGFVAWFGAVPGTGIEPRRCRVRQ